MSDVREDLKSHSEGKIVTVSPSMGSAGPIGNSTKAPESTVSLLSYECFCNLHPDLSSVLFGYLY